MGEEKGYPKFLSDTAVTQIDENTWEAKLTDSWSIGGVANGGYSMATAARALSESLDHKDPLSITGHYLSRVEPGKALLEIEKLNIGRSVSTAVLKFKQENQEKIRFTACFTDFSKSKGDTYMEREAPDFPLIEDCIKMPFEKGFTPVLEKQIDRRFAPYCDWWNKDRERGKACLDAYMAWPGQEKIDLFSVIFFLDTMSPPIFNRFGSRGWVPSLELTLHLRQKPAPGPLRMRGKTDFLTTGFLEEDDEIWDSEGKLIGQARQMAKLRIPKKK